MSNSYSRQDKRNDEEIVAPLGLAAGQRVGVAQSDEQSLMEQGVSSHLTNDELLASSNLLFQSYERSGDLTELQQTIAILDHFIRSTSVSDGLYLPALSNLGAALRRRFNRLGEVADLDNAIVKLRSANHLIPRGDSDKPVMLYNLGTCLKIRFQCLGQLNDLEDAISSQRDAVRLSSHTDPGKPGYLNGLGNALRARFQRLCSLDDLEEAISSQRHAVYLTPHRHPHKPSYLTSLGNSLKSRFQRLGQLGDLEEAISRHIDAVDLTPHGHSDMHRHLSNLGSSFRVRFERFSKLSDLGHAIFVQRNAVDLIPDGHPDKPCALDNLGNCFISHFERLGQLGSLEDAILMHRAAVSLTPRGHPDMPRYLSNVGGDLKTRFERLGQVSDLEEATSLLRDSVDLIPHGHHDKPNYLNHLADCLRSRSTYFGQLSDLEDAISMQKASISLTPPSHPDRPLHLDSLCSSLRARFMRLGRLSDLEDAISIQKSVVDLIPDTNPRKPNVFCRLGIYFFARFERLGQLGDLTDALAMQRNAVDLTPYGHPCKLVLLYNLNVFLNARFECLGQLNHDDFEDIISLQKDVIDLAPCGHPLKPLFLVQLGKYLTTRFDRLGKLGDLEQAISLFSRAALSPVGHVHTRFYASQKWISCACHIHHNSLLHAYFTALGLLPQLAWIGKTLTHNYHELIVVGAAGIVREAAAAALDAGFPKTAVEWLEQGRLIIWGRLFQLRTPYEELMDAYPDHAHRLHKLSAELDQARVTHEKLLSGLWPAGPTDVMHFTAEYPRQVADRQRALAIEQDKLLREIRQLPGFKQFLGPKRFIQLREAAHSGAVVILNAAETRCDALVVLADVDHVIHVPLPGFTFKESIRLQNFMTNFVREARVGQRATMSQVDWESMLSSLWTLVVKLVLDALAISEPGELSRIFWCPTGPFTFLPIHAAGLYGTQYSQSGYILSDYLVSSYVPALSIISLSHNPSVTPPTSNLRLLAVRQPPSDGLFQLSGVGPELNHIREAINNPPSAQAVFVESSEGTVEEVLRLMKEADWVHFACHGVQDAADPLHSGLCLAHERRLALRDIIALKRPRGGLAFLSACQTAMGDKALSDEAMHIAAGMLCTGYAGVVGTMWSISDRLAPEVAKDVYGHLFRDGGRPDCREAARALHEAIGRARRKGTSFADWVPFIHLGL